MSEDSESVWNVLRNLPDERIEYADFLRSTWIRDFFLPQVRTLREAVLEHMLPALPDAATEAKQLEQSLWDKAMSKPSDGSEDPADLADWVTNAGLDRYVALTGARQGALNMASAMLWHLLEQQMLVFLRQELLTHAEAAIIQCDRKERNRLCKLSEFLSRLTQMGVEVKALPSWKMLDELRLVANTVKHAAGDSADQLFKRRPDLFTAPGLNRMGFGKRDDANQVAQPAAGEDLYLSEADINTYFDAAESFWDELLGQL